jgi:hypothetical protein
MSMSVGEPTRQRTRCRRKARWAMRGLAATCALLALGLGADRIHSVGLQAFLDRPPGVGATPADSEADASPSPESDGGATALAPAAPEETPQPSTPSPPAQPLPPAVAPPPLPAPSPWPPPPLRSAPGESAVGPAGGLRRPRVVAPMIRAYRGLPLRN